MFVERTIESFCYCDETDLGRAGGGGGRGWVLPYMGDINMCGPKGYGFSAVLVINRVSN